MIYFLGISALIWFSGSYFKVRSYARLTLIIALLLFITSIFATLPENNPLLIAIGGSLQAWLFLLLAFCCVIFYRHGLKKLRILAVKRQAGMKDPSQNSQNALSNAEQERYARHILLRDIGGAGQKKLKEAKILVIGAGGIGCPALAYLGASGIGEIGIIDPDEVELSNLQRQIIHFDREIGNNKTRSAAQFLQAQNPALSIRAYPHALSEENASKIFERYDLIIDGSDNFTTKHIANQAAAQAGIPYLSASLSAWEGQWSLYDPKNGTPCYACVFPNAPEIEMNCAETGVMAALPGMIGTQLAGEAIKEITGSGTSIRGWLMLFDARDSEFTKITIKRRADCAICGESGDAGRI